MTLFKSSFLITLFFLNTLKAGVEMSGGEDVLDTVSRKLVLIEKQLKDQRVFIAPATLSWPEYNQFREELMFVVAHDPSGAIPKDTPLELIPSHLTRKLRASFSRLEESVYQMGTLVRGEEWRLIKDDIEKFLRYREEFLYIPSRVMIKSGHLSNRLDKLKQAAEFILQTNEGVKNISIRVIDPVIENLTKELNLLNISVHQLKELRKPVPVEVKTIFQEKNFIELLELTLGGAVLGVLCALIFNWSLSRATQVENSLISSQNRKSFDYYEWLKRLEFNLKAFKINEEYLTNEHKELKELSFDLHEARQRLLLADNQHDYEIGLKQLNQASPRLEEYFEKINVRKNTELSRRMICLVVQLCDALESHQEIVIKETTTKKDFQMPSQLDELNVA